MTLGATSIHPGVERIVLAEIEESVLGVAQTFSRWNSNVLEHPRLEIIFNDGRNFLATTRETFDVITADPIHPWSGGAGYLYTTEYFRSVAEHLAPGGVAAQWLPLYELSVDDVKTVVRTFSSSFLHTMVWLTYYDAVLVGSNQPIWLDEGALARRLSEPAIRQDLVVAGMSTPDDLLSFFLMGTTGAMTFGHGAVLNTDDNVVLEFSAPSSHGVPGLDGRNVAALTAARESILPHLVPDTPGTGRSTQLERWAHRDETGRRFGALHSRFLLGDLGPDFDRQLESLREWDPDYAPLRFLLGEKTFRDRTRPALVEAADFPVVTVNGRVGVIRMSIVRQYIGRGAVLVSLVDNARRQVYGQRYIDGEYNQLEGAIRQFSDDTIRVLRDAASALARGGANPPGEAQLSEEFRGVAERQVGRIREGATP